MIVLMQRTIKFNNLTNLKTEIDKYIALQLQWLKQMR